MGERSPLTQSICVAREGESEGSIGGGVRKGRGRCGVGKGLQGGRTSAAAKLSGLLPTATYSEAASQEPAAPADAVTADVGPL